MTDREKAIVMAYTGIAMFEGEKINEYYKYLKELYGRPVYTHEIVTLDIAERAKPDFIRLCEETHDKRPDPKDIEMGNIEEYMHAKYFRKAETPDKCTETHSCDYGEKETHGDVISRAEAIDDLHGQDPSQIWDTADIEAWINALPSAEPEQRWIPVSKIKNARNGELLVTRKCIRGNYLDIVTKTTMNSDMVASDILAWTYPPEPYQEKEDG